MGTIYRRKDTGKYYYQYYLSEFEDDLPEADRGKRKKIALDTGDEEEAEEQALKVERDLRLGLLSSFLRADSRVDMRIDEYLSNRKIDVAQKARSLKTYQNESHMLNAFMAYCKQKQGTGFYLTRVTATFMVKYFDYLKGYGESELSYTANTIRAHFRTLRSFFSFAVDHNWIQSNPCSGLGKTLPKSTRRENYPSLKTRKGVKEWNIILEHVKHQIHDSEYDYFYHVVFILMKTGMRLGEVLLLSWEPPVDENAPYATISESSAGGEGRLAFEVKLKRKTRTFEIPPELADVVKRIPKTQEYIDYRTGEITEIKKRFLFESPIIPGQPLTHGRIQKKFKRMMAELELPTVYTPHSLRHGFITMLLARNASIAKVGAFVGHSSTEITERYSHIGLDSFDDLHSIVD